jgi:hypothetical protein
LPVVLSHTLREEHRLRVFENRVLRRIFGPKRLKVGSWIKLHNDELHSLYSSPNIVGVIKSREMSWWDMWHAWRRGEVFTGFWLEGPKVRDHWEDLDVGGSIKVIDRMEIGIDGANWILVTQDRFQCGIL